MKVIWGGLAVGLLLITFASGQTGRSSAGSAFAGTWQGTSHGLPSIDLQIEDVGAKLTGTAVFYLQTRTDESERWHVASEATLPMVDPAAQGRNLTFEVRHQTCHGCKDYGPNVRFRMELMDQNEARLIRFGEAGEQTDTLKLVRSR